MLLQHLCIPNLGILPCCAASQGGVYLWEDGLPAPAITLPEHSAVAATAATTLTSARKQSLSDGLIEVVAIGGVTHMGRMAVGLARAQRLCQCHSVSITTSEPLPMQVDGEPWMQSPAEITIAHQGQVSGRQDEST